ncbi:MAG: transcription antitermination protein NusB [Rickettsiales bacterium]|nr:transcription antitermination protein NusB [Rickettsiales bacterium]
MSSNSDIANILDDYNKQRRSRIVAFQSVYNLNFLDEDDLVMLTLDNTLSLYLNGRKNPERYINKDLVSKIYKYIVDNLSYIDEEIIKHLKNEESFESLSLNVKSILRSAVAELIVFAEVDAPIIINEYTEISKDFENIEKSKFINAILDKTSKSVRF